jgi:antitoxin (DNA-binding transcriptional repressor) of toxin-antitoxin stability system
METVTATDLARNTREILEKVANQGQTVMVERNNAVIAQLSPPQKNMTVRQALSGLMLAPTLSVVQSKSWLVASKSSFDDGVKSPWE